LKTPLIDRMPFIGAAASGTAFVLGGFFGKLGFFIGLPLGAMIAFIALKDEKCKLKLLETKRIRSLGMPISLKELKELGHKIDSEYVVADDFPDMFRQLNENYSQWTLLRAPKWIGDKLVALVIRPREDDDEP
jgi:hypothetical protein